MESVFTVEGEGMVAMVVFKSDGNDDAFRGLNPIDNLFE